jgi:hypothetical protein
MKVRPAVAEQPDGTPHITEQQLLVFRDFSGGIAVIATAGLGCAGYDKIFIAEPFTSAAAPDYKRG